MRLLDRKTLVAALAGILLAAALAVPGAWAADRLAVKGSIANLRSGAGTSYKVLWQVEKYHPFLVIKKNGDWCEVKDFEGDTAWIHQSLLTDVKTVISIKSKCNIRSEPSTKSRVVLQAERGVPFKTLERKGDWIHVQHADGETGWIYKTLVW